MQLGCLGRLSQRNRSGRILLILVAVAMTIGLILYFVDLSGFSGQPDPDTGDELAPRQEWRIRESVKQAEQEPSEEQPDIAGGVQCKGAVYLDEEPRGKIYLGIGPDGNVTGSWHGKYNKGPKVLLDIMGGDFAGKIYPSRLYRDEEGEELSKLYFLTKGKFRIEILRFYNWNR